VALAELGRAVHWSGAHLQRVFTRLVGVSPRSYGEACRTQLGRRALLASGSVGEAVYDAGYGSVRAFYEETGRRLGMTPSTYAAGGRGATVRIGLVDTVLGRVLVAATESGLCAVRIGHDDEALLASLRAELPRAAFVRADEELGDVLAAVAALARGEKAGVDLPLDVASTAFQARVWDALQSIPTGETRSYAQIAAEIGHPTAVRAVGRACATNPVALVVPCHRVVRSDGSLGGYRWGLEVKSALLASEARGSAPRAPADRA